MANTYKVLGQSDLTPTVSGYTEIYEVPAGASAAVSSVSIVNTSVSSADYSLYAVSEADFDAAYTPYSATSPETAWVANANVLDGEDFFSAGVQREVNLGFYGTGQAKEIGVSKDGSRVILPGDSTSTPPSVWEKQTNGWAKLGAISAFSTYTTGSTVISGDGSTIAVTNSVGSGSRSVAIFTWNGSSWVQRGSNITGSTSAFAESRWPGPQIALNYDGTVFAAGDTLETSQRGTVKVYAWNGSSWAQRGSTITGVLTNPVENFGGVVKLNDFGDLLLVGSPWTDVPAGNAGRVRLYAWNGVSWTASTNEPTGGALNEELGSAIDITDGGTATVFAAASPGYYDPSTGLGGAVKVYCVQGVNTIAQMGSTILTELDNTNVNPQKGIFVSLSNNGLRLAIGTPGYGYYTFNPTVQHSDAGRVKIYDYSLTSATPGGEWVQVYDSIIGEDNSRFGIVALDSTGTIVTTFADSHVSSQVASPTNLSYRGKVEVYEVGTAQTGPPVQASLALENKHAFISDKAISSEQHHEITGGITLSSGDRLYASSSNSEIVVTVSGVEVS